VFGGTLNLAQSINSPFRTMADFKATSQLFPL